MDDWLPEGEKTRTTFIILVVGLCALLALVRWAVLPLIFGTSSGDAGEVVDELIGTFIATALAGTALALLLRWLFPSPDRPPIVKDVPAHEIGGILEKALPDTRRWWFDGSTGRYQRSTTLPTLARKARSGGISREVMIVILDPTDEDLCRRYGNYRSGVSKGNEQYSVDRVRIDLYATILTALDCNDRQPLNVTVAIKSTMSVLRYDLSDSQLVITKEGRTDPAILCPAESFYYDAFLEQLRMSLKQAHPLDFTKATVPTAGFDRVSARAACADLGIATDSLDDDEVIDRVLAELESPQSPYA